MKNVTATIEWMGPTRNYHMIAARLQTETEYHSVLVYKYQDGRVKLNPAVSTGEPFFERLKSGSILELCEGPHIVAVCTIE